MKQRNCDKSCVEKKIAYIYDQNGFEAECILQKRGEFKINPGSYYVTDYYFQLAMLFKWKQERMY